MEFTDEVTAYASECLGCKNPMCKRGCPLTTNIPEFINEIKNKNFAEAYYILQNNNIMSEICSTICPVEEQCMGNCIKGIKGEPVKINYLERFINSWAKENNISYEIEYNNSLNGKVAIIGSGPAGIACAIALRKYGIDVTIYEKEEKFGGILQYGIPDFRLDKNKILALEDKVKELGIDIKTNVELGKDITIEDLRKQGYENIFLGVGAQRQTRYTLSEEETKDIYESDKFLKAYNNGKHIRNLGITAVIGGGNVAIDSARAAIRMGAKEVYILYRRNRELMPARDIEIQEAIEDGIKIIYQTKVISAEVEDTKIKEIQCIKTKIENDKAVDIEGSNYRMKANTIVYAIGARVDENFFEKLGIRTEKRSSCCR